MSGTNAELSRDSIFEILSNPRRRYILYYLRQQSDETDLQELAAQVAAWENDVAVDDLTKQERKRVYVSLYQTHIPKLADAGIIDYDRDEGSVALTDRAHEVQEYLTADQGWQFPWYLYYVGLAVVSSLFFLAVSLDMAGFGAVPEVVAAALVIVAFAASAAVQYLYARYRYRNLSLDAVTNR